MVTTVNLPFETRALVEATTVTSNADYIRTAGYSAIGDGGGALYKRVSSEPSHEFKVQSGDGAWWEGVAEPDIAVEQLGAAGDGATDDTTAFQNAIDALPARGGRLILRASNYIVTLGSLGVGSKAVVLDGFSQIGGAGGGTMWRYDSGAGTWLEFGPPDSVMRNRTATITAGYAQTPHDIGTVSGGTTTPDEANGAMQKLVNGGAFTLAPPTNNTSLLIKVTNNATAGAITTSGFTTVTGDSFTTTNTAAFLCTVNKLDGSSHLHVTALQ